MDPIPVIIFVAEQLILFIEKRGKIAINFNVELDEMKAHLEMMQSYLADTDNLKKKNMVLKTTLKKLRDLMYEADDILTDCLLNDEYNNGFFIFRKISRHKMGKKLRDINARMDKLESNLKQHLTAQEVTPEGSRRETTYPGMFSSSPVFNSSEVVGLERDLLKIRGWISSGGGDGSGQILQRIGIVGMGGLGKTTIAQKVFDDKGVASMFEHLIWVSISQCFIEENVLGCILQQLAGDCSIFDKGQMLRKIHQLLTDKTYLIVLDDVWPANVAPVNDLCSKLPKPAAGIGRSWVIVTTRTERVATEMQVDNTRIHRPENLNKDQSWTLFCRNAFYKTGGKCQDDHFKELGKKIAGRCGGLPLAIKTIGALLASKDGEYNNWKEIEENFHRELRENSSSSLIMASLQLSYSDLPSKLKQFLLCFSIYPEDAVIEGEKLIGWWSGEGLIQSKDSKTATEVGYEYLSELASRCLIEVKDRRKYDGRIYSCRMHDMVRELTISMAQDEGFCHFDDNGRQKLGQPDDSRWLGLTDHLNTNALKEVPDLKVRAMLQLVSSPSAPSSTSQLDMNVMELQLKSLRVLDLSHSKVKLTEDKEVKAFWNWITSLERLAYLNISTLSTLKNLPSSIEKLRNLQILILRGCNSLIEIEPSIINLKKLVVLDVGRCKLEYLPRGIGKLSNLQELSGFRIAGVDNKQCCRFSELKELSQLRVLRINLSDESSISEDELSTLSQLSKLKVLAINADECSSSSSRKKMAKFGDGHILKMMDRLSPPPNLQELYLKNYRLYALWSWINPAALLKLHYLCIEDGNLDELRGSGGGCSWKIEGLYVKFLPRLEMEWEALTKKDMPLLRYVEASHCHSLKGFPFDVVRGDVWYKNQSLYVEKETV